MAKDAATDISGDSAKAPMTGGQIARALHTRRELVRTGLVTGVGLTAFGPLLAACGSSSSSTNGTVTAASAGQKIGGQLNFINVPGSSFPGEFKDFQNEFGTNVN